MTRRPRGKAKPFKSIAKVIKELILNSTEDRALALEVFNKAKGDIGNAVDSIDRDSLRKLQVECLKLAQSSKAANIKAVELYIKHQEAEFNAAEGAAGEAVEEGFLGDNG